MGTISEKVRLAVEIGSTIAEMLGAAVNEMKEQDGFLD